MTSKPLHSLTGGYSLSGFFYKKNQSGAILILVLWLVALMSLLIATLASEVRLSAKAVFYNQGNVQVWAKTLQALHLAEMELMIQRMPLPPEELQKPLSERVNPLARFNGQVLTLSNPTPKGVTVRIYDHAGKINVRNLNDSLLSEWLRERIGEDDPERLGSLLDAWRDWKDRDDLKRLNGAEKAYYEKLDPPYEPRNNLFETLEEIRLIKGFDELLQNLDLNTLFTIYGGTYRVNPNFAPPEVLRLIPGMTGEAVSQIISLREEQDIKQISDFNDLMEPNTRNKIQRWLEFGRNGSGVYTIAIQVDPNAEEHAEDEADEPSKDKPQNNAAHPTNSSNTPQYAFLATVQVRGYATPPKVLKIEPYGRLPGNNHPMLPSTSEEKVI